MSNRINVLDMGAVSDGTLQTDAIQAAIDYIGQLGKGEVIVPKGTFIVGTLRLRSGVVLHLQKGAVLQGSDNWEDYVQGKVYSCCAYSPLCPRPDSFRFSRWHNSLISACDAENIGIIGEGALLDGVDCYDPHGEEGFRGPHLFYFTGCSNIKLQGYTIQRSANYAHLFEDCSDIEIKEVTVLGGHDGVHLQRCKNAVIQDCTINTGDDCIAGADNSNIKVLYCDINTSCNGFRFGSRGLLVKGCHIHGPGLYKHKKSNRNNMLSAFQYYSPIDRKVQTLGGDWHVTNCTIDTVDYIFIYNFNSEDKWQCAQPLNDICFENVDATNVFNPIIAYGDEAQQLSLSLEQFNLSLAKDYESKPAISIYNFSKLKLKGFAVLNNSSVPLIEAYSMGLISLEEVYSHTRGELVATYEATKLLNIKNF